MPELDLEWIGEYPKALTTAPGMAAEVLVFGGHAYWFRGRMPKGADPAGYVNAEDYFSLKESDGDQLGSREYRREAASYLKRPPNWP